MIVQGHLFWNEWKRNKGYFIHIII